MTAPATTAELHTTTQTVLAELTAATAASRTARLGYSAAECGAVTDAQCFMAMANWPTATEIRKA